jgi:hypothetical protein
MSYGMLLWQQPKPRAQRHATGQETAPGQGDSASVKGPCLPLAWLQKAAHLQGRHQDRGLPDHCKQNREGEDGKLSMNCPPLIDLATQKDGQFQRGEQAPFAAYLYSDISKNRQLQFSKGPDYFGALP